MEREAYKGNRVSDRVQFRMEIHYLEVQGEKNEHKLQVNSTWTYKEYGVE